MAGSSGFVDPSGSGRQWYDLFSRGARDWLRHNDKVRAAVRDKLPELIAGSELLPNANRRSEEHTSELQTPNNNS